MFVPSRVWMAIVVLVALARGVWAETIAVGMVSAEADVADEAGAVTLLVHTGLAGDDRKVIAAPPELALASASAGLAKVGADHGVLLDLGRDGLALRLTVVIVAATGDPSVHVVRAGDGEVHALARDAVEHVTTKLELMKSRVPDVALGRLRPYAAALRLRGTDAAAAARALADAAANTTLNVAAAPVLLAGVPAAGADPATAAIAARALGDTAHLAKLGAGSDDLAVAARALAALARSDVSAAKAELAGKPIAGGLPTLVAARLAELAGDRKRLDALLVQGLATDQARAILAFASTLDSIPKDALAPLVAAAERAPDAPGVASLIGLAAAEAAPAGPAKARALALVSVRELDELGLQRVEAAIAGATDPTSLRLRAELSIRRRDGREALAIGAFVAAAPDDPRAQRYQGWLLGSQDRHAEAAVAFAKANARGEQLRALLRAGDVRAAAALVVPPPKSPEERVALARAALLAGKLAEADVLLVAAEQHAPVSPLVQTALIELGTQQANPTRVRLGRLLVGIPTDAPLPAPTVVVAPVKPAAGDPVVIDLGAAAADARPIAPMLEALQLAELAKKKIVLAELRAERSLLSFRQAHPTVLRGALAQLLAAPPYDMQVTLAAKAYEGAQVPVSALVALAKDVDAVLVYRVESAGSRGAVTLLLYQTGTTQAAQVAREVTLAGLVTFDVIKLGVIIGVLVTLALLGILYFTRAMGRIELQIAREAAADEALCVEISKSPTRPKIDDMLAFHEATKSAGAVTRSRHATLIASGFMTKVPVGTWYVHLYGTYAHAGKLRVIPDWCTQQVEVKRGERVEVAFDLVAKGAEITVQVIAEPRAGVMVWTDKDPTRRATDAAGEVELMLPLGSYIVHIDAHGTELTTDVQVTSTRPQRVSINVERELRLMRGVELDADDGANLELVLTPSGPRTPLPFPAATPPPAAAIDATAKTQASSGAMAVLRGTGGRSQPRAATPVPGDVLLGRYRVTAELGRGAMGLVHRAWDEKLEREVAIKEMADDLRSIPEAMQLFTQEAKALAQLNHTNIVAMYDQVTDDDKVYMIMEYVDGQPLEAIVAARGALPWLEAAGLIDQACAGLAYAHARKVIHRDIKPANIFVAKDSTVKLGDFGLARVMREVTIRRTEIRGTPLYMAPEQITGTDVDHRCDLYAVGCTLFELVCGRPPFIEGDILFAQLNTAPPAPSQLVPELPKALDALILSLIAKRPRDRPASAADVRATLRGLS